MSRIRNRLARSRREANYRLDQNDRRLTEIEARLGALESGLHLAISSELPGLLLLSERRHQDAMDDVVLGIRSSLASATLDVGRAVEAAREVAEQALAAAAAAHDASSTAAVTSREDSIAHTDQAIRAAMELTLEAAREHAEAVSSQAQATATVAAAAAIHDELVALRRNLRATQITARSPPHLEVTTAATIDPAFYVSLEDRFRGDPSLITERQRIYVPLVEQIVDQDHPLVDLGCGRGEWLAILAEAAIPAMGVDSNPAFVDEVRAAGLDVVAEDLICHLRSCADESLGAVSLFQVVEHLPVPVLIDLLAECCRVLRPGGILIAETPNSLNLRVGASTFWIDPTHVRPIHPEFLQHIATYVGFSKVDGWFVNDLGDPPLEISADPTGAHVRRLLDMVDGAGDFALLAWR